MKKIITLLILSTFLISLVPAQIVETEDVELAGMTPDHPFYGLDIAFEKIGEFFNKNSKLNHARERLAEMKIMINQSKFELANKTRHRFEHTYQFVENKTQLKEHKHLMDNLGQKIKTILQQREQVNYVNGNLTINERSEIRNLIELHKSEVAEESNRIKEITQTRSELSVANQNQRGR